MNYNDRRTFVICLTVILLLSIPLCFFVFLVPPKTVILWWSDDLTSIDSLSSSPDSPPLLLLISYDGFRYDYVEKTDNTPTFRWLIKNGVHATQGLKNTFITITAPNHYGIVSGLYEEEHGVVANDFYDPDLKERFDYFDSRWKTDPKMFEKGEPIWNINDKADPNRGTGCVMWVGCDVPIRGHLPMHYIPWDQNLAWTARVDALISWFTHPEKPINFGVLYIEEPDETGHRFGPDSPNITEMVQKMDQLTSYLMWRLYTEKLLDRMNIIFTADHGMSTVPALNAVSLDYYVNRSLYTVYGGTPNWNVDPKPGHEAEIYNALYNKVPHLNVYNKTTIPEDFHYRNNSRIMPLQLVADVHWWITYNATADALDNSRNPNLVVRKIHGKNVTIDLTKSNYSTGEHGYNNSFPEMHPYFIGFGPAFKVGYNVTQFMNLDLYPLMAYILDVKPAPSNASFDRVRKILKDEGRRWAKFGFNPPTTTTTAKSTDGVTIEYEYAADDRPFSFLYTTNFDFVIMFVLLFSYISLMLSMIRKLKPIEEDATKLVAEFPEKRQTSFVFAA